MSYIHTFYKRIIYLLIIYTSSRILFYLFNTSYFQENVLWSIIEGIRFDISAIFYINLILLILILAPIASRNTKKYQYITNSIFYITNIPFIIINNIDIEYYKFSLKRTTADIFEYLSLGSGVDAVTILPQYLIDYWYISLIIIIQIYLLLQIKYIPSNKTISYTKEIPLFLLSVFLFVLGVRGGTQLKPIKPIDAGIISDERNSGLVLNSPFCILHTISEEKLLSKTYFSEKEIKKIYSPNNEENKKEKEIEKQNIIIIILESFSKEYIGFYNKNKGYTPFLDSIMNHSLVMENAYSNGIKSIEALPAITASIPTLMNNPFITSSYATNNYQGIGSLMKKKGYSTSFFHGGEQGTMGFYQFSNKAGFDKYFGMKEYNHNNDYDGSWGIYDEPFFQYYAKYLSSENSPFISCIFSVSSHPPFNLPKKYKNTFPEGELAIHRTISYTDFSLKKFFNKIKDEEWFQNTLFVITADHTSPQSIKKEYHNRLGRYSIPIIYYKGDNSMKDSLQEYRDIVTQQIDIMPTILDIINYNEPFFSFGESIFKKKDWAISFLEETYLFIKRNEFVINKEEDYKTFSDKNLNFQMENNKNSIDLLKAIKQTYNKSLNSNKMQYNED